MKEGPGSGEGRGSDEGAQASVLRDELGNGFGERVVLPEA